MRFTRARVTVETPTGNNTASIAVLFPEITDLVFSLASAADGSTVALPAQYSAESRFLIELSGQRQIYVGIDLNALGAAGLTGIDTLIEFQDPDDPENWIPSKEGVTRTETAANHTWTAGAVGSYLLASRIEAPHFKRARVSFKRTGGTPDADTDIRCRWFHDGIPVDRGLA